MTRFTEESLLRSVFLGAYKLSDLVSTTYGPNGGHVLLERRSGRIFSRDGFTVACEIEFDSRMESCGAEVVKELCGKINRKVGDGTTTAIIFLSALLKESEKYLIAGIKPRFLIKGIRIALQEAEGLLSALRKPCRRSSSVEKLARMAVHGEGELSDLICRALFSTPPGGTVVIEDAPGVDSYIDLKSGLSVEGGFVSTSLQDLEWDLPQVAIFKKGLSKAEQIVPVAEEASQWPHPLVIVAPYVRGEALETLRMNPSLNGQPWTAVRFHSHWKFGEGWLQDLVALTGATLVDENIGNSPLNFKADWLGFCRRVSISEKRTVFTANEEGSGRLSSRVGELKRQILDTESGHDRRILEKQISMLSGGLCNLYIGAVTEEERKERRSRVEDALFSVRSGVEGGILPGCGSSFLTARDFVLSRKLPQDDSRYGSLAFCSALEVPCVVLLKNSNRNRSDLELLKKKREEEKNFWLGWDLVRDEIVDCEKHGPWDTYKGSVEILRGACSVAEVLLNSGAVVWKRKIK